MASETQITLPGFTTKGQALFMKRSGQLIHSLNARMRKKEFTGRMSLTVGREVMARGVGKPCRYCGVIIKISTMSPDHPTPISKGGDPWTIECICINCQLVKGELDADEMTRFMAHVRTYSPESQRHILGMMKGGAAYQRVLAISRGKFKRKKLETGVSDGGSIQEGALIEGVLNA